MIYLAYKLASLIDPSQLKNLPKGTPDSVLSTGLKVVFAVAGAISILVIVLAGLRMVVSVGNPDAVNKARNTIVFAAVGLIVCLTGFIIVGFVVNRL